MDTEEKEAPKDENPWLWKPGFRPPGAGIRKGGKHRITQLWERAEDLAYDAEYVNRSGQTKRFRIRSPFDVLLFIAMTAQDPRIGMIDAKLGEKSPFKVAERSTAPGPQSGGSLHARGFITTEDWMNAIRLLQPYMLNKLAAVEVTGPDGAPLSANVDVVKALSVLPEVRRMMEEVQKRAVELTTDEEATFAGVLGPPEPSTDPGPRETLETLVETP